MKLNVLHGLILCTCIVCAVAQAPAPAPSHNRDEKVEHVSFVTEDGALIYADLYGKGNRSGVVLAHGGRFTKESWKPQAESLAREGFRVLALDFRGFGKSHGPGDSDMFTAPTHLDVLAAVHYLRDNGAKSVAVMGGSFGGQRRRMRVLRRDRERLTASYFLQQPEINQRNKSMFRC